MKFPIAHAYAVAVLAMATGAFAADLSVPDVRGEIDPPTLRSFVTDEVLLLQIRTMFDVFDASEIQSQALADARLATESSFNERADLLRQDLQAEGSYYIVSLSYLVAAGGANWPLTQSSLTFERDAAVHLEEAKRSWLASFSDEAGASERLAILENVDRINAWTEGELEATEDLDHFGLTRELVNKVLSEL